MSVIPMFAAVSETCRLRSAQDETSTPVDINIGNKRSRKIFRPVTFIHMEEIKKKNNGWPLASQRGMAPGSMPGPVSYIF